MKKAFDRFYLFVWIRLFSLAAAIIRREKMGRLGLRIMRFLAWQSMLIRGVKRQDSLDGAVREWQRMFPSPDINRIVSIEGETARAQVQIRCPLKGTGDLLSCYRLMEYDRAMLRKIGGQLVVLRSQAEPGVEFCELALRKAGVDTGDLVPAHERQQQVSWKKGAF